MNNSFNEGTQQTLSPAKKPRTDPFPKILSGDQVDIWSPGGKDLALIRHGGELTRVPRNPAMTEITAALPRASPLPSVVVRVATGVAKEGYLASIRGRVKPKTLENYKGILDRLEQDYPELPTRPEQVEAWLGSMNLSKGSYRTYLKWLKAFFCWASDRHGIPDPTKPIKAPPAPKKTQPVLTRGERERLVRVPP